MVFNEGGKLTVKATESGYLYTLTNPKVMQTLIYSNETNEKVVISSCKAAGAAEFVNKPEIPITIPPKGQAAFNLLMPHKYHFKENGAIELTAKYIDFELKSYYYIMGSKFGVSVTSLDDAKKKSENLPSHELTYDNGVKLAAKATEWGYLAALHPKSKVMRTLAYTNETEEPVVISSCRAVGTAELVSSANIPITIQPKGQATLNFLIPDKNHSVEGGGIELTAKYIEFELKSYYYIMGSDFGVSSASLDEAKKNSDSLANKEFTY